MAVPVKRKWGGPQPGSGRPKGKKNKSTIAREEAAKAAMADAVRAARRKGAEPKNALNEMYKALQISEGFLGSVQPQIILDEKTKEPVRDKSGKVLFKGGDLALFTTWFPLWTDCIKLLAKYQLPPMKGVEAPAPPPDPDELEASRVKRFTLRVFEGGKQVEPFKATDPDAETDE